jgi:hypothetical protein|tara:strand:+ start:997 stop:1722 length:726 start_codon:yes stop_codon:yes gene_type:complete
MPKDWEKLGPGKQAKLAREYGELFDIDRDQFQEKDTGSQGYFDSDAYRAAIAKAANDNYEFKESIELAKLSGYEGADDLSKGINNMDELQNAYHFMKGIHEDELKNTGKFSSANDLGNVTNYLAKYDRDALKDYIASSAEKPTTDEPVVPVVDPEDTKLSDRTKEAIEYVDNHSWYDPDVKLVQDTIPLTAAATDMNAGIANKVASAFTDKYKLNLVAGLQKADIPTRGAGAPGTPGGFRI